MLKKSTASAITSAIITAEGISIIIPTLISLLKTIPSLSRESAASFKILFVSEISSQLDIMGISSRTLPNAAALNIALSCVLKTSGFCRQYLMARSPRAGFVSSDSEPGEIALSPFMSRVRMVTGFGAITSTTSLYLSNNSSSSGKSGRFRY